MKYNAFISYAHAADGQLTPVLQSALHKLGKPWYKRRALNVFRDKTNLPVTPELWPTIVKALEQSEYFILMASPESAASKWVLPEVDYWLTHRSIDTLLIVHSGGILCWDDKKEDFDPEKTDALHPVLFGKFLHEPFIVDLTAIKSAKDRSLSNPQFRDPVIRLAATLHKLPQNDFIGEEIKQHKRTLRIRNGAITVLSLLLLGVGFFFWRSVQNGKMSRKNLSQTLTILADIKVEEDPTLSFRLAEAAYKNDPENTDAHIRLMDAANYYLYDVIPGKVLGMSDDYSKMVYIDDKTSELCVLDFNTKDTIRFDEDLSAVSPSFLKYSVGSDFSSVSRKIFFNKDLTKFFLIIPNPIDIIRVFDLERKAELILNGNTNGSNAGFSPSGNKLFISDLRGLLPLRIWDLNTGQILPLKGKTESYNIAAFTFNDNYLLAANNDGKTPVKIWNLANGNSIHIPSNNIRDSKTKRYYSNFKVSSNGKRFAVLRGNSAKGELSVYEITSSVNCILRETMSALREIEFTKDEDKLIAFYERERVSALREIEIEFTKDKDKLIAFNSWRNEPIRAFDLLIQKEIILENTQSYSDKKVQIAADGSRVVEFSPAIYDQTSLWDLESGNKIILEENTEGYSHGGFSSKNHRLIGLGLAGELPVRIWDSKSGNLLFTSFYPYRLPKASFSDKGKKLVLYSQYSNSIKFIDLDTEKEWEFLGNVPGANEVVFTPGAQQIISINYKTGDSRIWDITTKTAIIIFEQENQYNDVRFLKDGMIAIFSGKDKEWNEIVYIWDLKRAKEIDLPASGEGFNRIILSPDVKKILFYNNSDNEKPIWISELPYGETKILPKPGISFSKLSFNPYGDKLLVHDKSSEKIKVYDLKTLDTIPLKGSSGYSDIVFSKTGDKLLTYHYNGEKPPVVWDLKNGRKIHAPEAIRNFRYFKISPNGFQVIAYGDFTSNNNISKMIFWNLFTGDIVPIKTNFYASYNAFFSPDGLWFLAHDYDGEIMFQLWNTKTWEAIELEGNYVGLNNFYFSRDGSKLGTHKEDEELVVWDLISPKPKLILKTDISFYSRIDFTPDNKKVKIIDTFNEMVMRVWDLKTGKVVEFDNVTEKILREYVISDSYLLVEHYNGVKNICNLTSGNIHELKSFGDERFLGIHYNEEKKSSLSSPETVLSVSFLPTRILSLKKSIAEKVEYGSWIHERELSMGCLRRIEETGQIKKLEIF